MKLINKDFVTTKQRAKDFNFNLSIRPAATKKTKEHKQNFLKGVLINEDKNRLD